MSSVGADVGLRERKKQQTREALHRAAIHLYLERGPDSVTVNDICAAAGVSRRTFFNYFDSKDDAVLDWNEEQSGGSLAERIAARPADADPLQAVHQAIRAGIRRLLEHPTWRERQQLVRQNPRLAPMAFANNRRTQASIAEGVARRTGLTADDLYPRALAGAAHAVTRTALAQWNPEDPGSELLAILDTSFEMLASGFAAP
ncbi:TetR family transcriptional regulator [Streptomyces sp. NPDC002928]|uniref:acyl-CoA-like ligand-binding transcription factor n=1 Tax=Streptomyces sp. NPDC002928 TaxID=3154440 RepID=UPI0033A3D8BE